MSEVYLHSCLLEPTREEVYELLKAINEELIALETTNILQTNMPSDVNGYKSKG